jgi:hypothetical protein
MYALIPLLYSRMSSYPLPLLPSIPDDLENIDARHALPHLMALMKNTLIRGLNRIHACAPLITTHHPALPPFLDYVRSLLMHLNAHLEEDATFFSTSALAEIVTSEANPDTEAIRESIASLLSLVSDWIKVHNVPSKYTSFNPPFSLAHRTNPLTVRVFYATDSRLEPDWLRLCKYTSKC